MNDLSHKPSVLVGMSGGVDSSVTVALLREQGYQVQGAVILFSPAHEKAVEEAKTAARQLDVPLTVLDARADFEAHVAAPFCASYCAGRTPNPCLLCNPNVKFRSLVQAADRLGCEKIATGHYARVEQDEKGVWRVFRPKSDARDQTYMLYGLGQEVLSRLLLPLGENQKPEIREMARQAQLECADSPDSMEICFIPDGDHAAYIAARGLHAPAGQFISPDGKALGPNLGIDHYTVGQRKGLGLALGRPAYVCGRDLVHNTVTVGPPQALACRALTAKTVNWVALAGLAGPLRVQACTRYHQLPQAATVTPCGEGVRVTFDSPQRAVSPGQTVVLYDGELVLAAGAIDQTFPEIETEE